MRRLWIVGLVIAAAAVVVVVVSIVISGDDEPAATSTAADDQTGPDEAATSTPTAETTLVDVEQIPGDPLQSVPSALDDMEDEAFPEPLVDPAEIRSGGPPPDGIPPIDAPRFQPASTVGVYRATLAGATVSLEPNGDGTFTDTATDTTFDILGTTVAGESAGDQLEPVEHLDTFWFAIAAFEPDTRIITP